MERQVMITMTVDELRTIIKEEVKAAVEETISYKQLPPLLNRQQLMELFSIKAPTVQKLLMRPDFPVLEKVGVGKLVPTDKLFEWIESHTRWREM